VPLKGDQLDQIEIGQVSIFGDLVGILLGGELVVYNWKTGLCILVSYCFSPPKNSVAVINIIPF
jgi:hypothetical protein